MHLYINPITGILALVCGLAACALTVPADAAPPKGYKLTWSEEFKQPVGSPPDPARWNYDLGANGWGNGELENYVRDPANGQVISDKKATDGRAFRIRAISDGKGGYTSCRMHTAGKVTANFGYIEGRLRLPRGQGIWPAFWMLAADIDKTGWPNGGEIDIMENVGHEPSVVHGTLHGPGYSGVQGVGSTFTLPKGKAFADAYHTFGILWKQDAITFYVDGKPYKTRTPADLPNGAKWVYNKPFFFIVNLAVGGGWPGNPDATTQFPQDYLIDYIRVYQPK